MINQHKIQTIKTANVYTLGDINNSKKILIVLHGYGQLAKYFIQKFTQITANGHAIIAPEGISKFYLNGVSGRVGASWMTKEERETEIKDYCNYINQLYSEFKLKNKKITLLGFSQGGSTAQRVFTSQNYYERLILCSCTINLEEFIDKQKTIFIYGKNDKYFDEKYISSITQKIKATNIIKFDGDHQINIESINRAIKKEL